MEVGHECDRLGVVEFAVGVECVAGVRVGLVDGEGGVDASVEVVEDVDFDGLECEPFACGPQLDCGVGFLFENAGEGGEGAVDSGLVVGGYEDDVWFVVGYL